MAAATIGLFAQLGLTVLGGFALRKALDGTLRGVRLAARVRALLNRLVLWVTLPALVFQTVQAAPLGPDLVQAPAVAVAGMAGTVLVAWALLARLHGQTPQTGGLVLAASAGSVSFFGIPLARAVFGPDAARVAVYFAVLNVPLALLCGALLSSRIARAAAGDRLTRGAAAYVMRHLLRQFFTLPATWAVVAGLALHGVSLPADVTWTLDGLARTVAPTTMFALGLGLRFERALAPYRMALPAVAIKLAVSPAVVVACAWVAGLSGLPLAVVALQGAMPTQVLSVVVAERYRLDARLVGLTLALDTALAFVLLPLVLAAVGAGTTA